MNKQRTFFKKDPILINILQRDKYKSYPSGLVDLMQEAVMGKLPSLTVKWTQRLIANPHPDGDKASKDQWRDHFLKMLANYENSAA